MSDTCELLCLDLPSAERVRAAMPSADRIMRWASSAQACADPTRLSLLAALAEAEELCVCDLGWVVAKPQNVVSHHLRKLRDAGMVSSRRSAKIVHYSLTPYASAVLGSFAKLAEV